MRFVCDSCRAQYMISDDKVGAKGVKVRCKKCGYVILVRKPEAADDESTRVALNPFAGENTSASGAPSSGDLTPPPGGEPPAPSSDTPFAAEGGPGSDTKPPTDPNNVLGGLEDDEIGAVFDQVLKTAPKPAEPSINSLELPKENESLSLNMDDTESTRVLSLDALKKLAAESGEAGEGAIPTTAGDAPQPAAKKVPQNDWFVAVDDNQVGPLTLEKVKEMWEAGEIGAESLCWRAGFSDWIPMSEVQDLAAELAPRPAKPVIVAPASVTGPTPTAALQVESAFSAGAMASGRDTPMRGSPHASGMDSEPGPTESGSWKPSAASALASLAMQEVEALSKPAVSAARATPQPMPAIGGLLDLPSPDAGGSNAHAGAVALSPTQMGGPTPDPRDPRAAPVLSPGYSSVSAPYPQPAYNTYTPPAPAPAAGGNKTLLIVGGIGGTIVVGLLVAVLVVMLRGPATPVYAPPPVQVAQAQLPQHPVQQGTAAPASAQPAPSGTQPAVATAAGTTQPAKVDVPMPPPPPGAKETAAPTRLAQAETPKEPTPRSADEASERHRGSKGSGSRHAREESGGGGEEFSSPVKSGKPPPEPSGDDDDFAKAFGGGSKSSDAPAPKKHKSDVYIPDAPGGGGSIPDSLQPSDIMATVLANKPALVNCVSEQKKRNPGVSGRLVMQWDISPSGRTSHISVVSDEFKSTYMAQCMSGLIKGWQFPKHKTQGDPVKFPFNF